MTLPDNDKNAGLVSPTSETNSLILHAQQVCSYGKCSYCANFKEGKRDKFNIREFREFLEEESGKYLSEEIDSVFLAEGNIIDMEVKKILEIMSAIKEFFPNVESISAYGSALSVRQHKSKDFRVLREAGLSRIHMGFESGNDAVLELLNKGISSEEVAIAAQSILDAEIELYMYVLVGSGGKELSNAHVQDTAKCVNAIKPDLIECHTLTLVPHTPLHELYEAGEFTPLSPHEAISEVKQLIEEIDVEIGVSCSHVSNYCQIHGRLQADKVRLIGQLNTCLTIDEENFKDSGLLNITIPA